jgi:thiamine biosynthesis protein ThiS
METLIKNLKIIVNGSSIQISEGANITDLLRDLDLNGGMVAVELNAAIIPKNEYSGRNLQEGDVLEIVHFVGGG